MSADSVRERLHALGPGVTAAAAFGIGDTFAKVALAAGADVLTLALTRGVVGVAILFLYLRLGAPPQPATRGSAQSGQAVVVWSYDRIGSFLCARQFIA